MAPKHYKISIEGHLDESWAMWFDGMTFINGFNAEEEPITLITGPVIDQASLYGMLCRLRDMGVHLISVQVHPEPGAKTSDNGNPSN